MQQQAVAWAAERSNTHAFIYDLSTSTVTDLTLGGTYSCATAMSGNVVVGQSSSGGFAYDVSTSTMTDLGSLSPSAISGNA